MITYLGVFFQFLKILIFWAKNWVKEQQCFKIGKKVVGNLTEEQHVV